MKSLLFLLGLAAISAQAQPVFRAGVSAIDITPTTFPRIIAGGFLEGRGDKIVDRLHVRSFVMDDGKMKIAFAIVDTCMMEQSLIDEAKALASNQCGIPVDRMMVSATHTHSAPAAMGCLGTRKDTEYGKYLTPKIAEAIVAADKALQPARIGWGSFNDWEHTHNRRWIRLPGKEVVDPFGQPTGRANMHPGYLSEDVVGPSGPVDPQLSVISLQTTDGKPLGVLANYSQHYFGSGPVSADYYGLFCKHLAAKLGQPGDGNGPFVCAMSQGTSGDQMWMDYGAEKKYITLDTYSAAVADSATKALQTVKYLDHAPLGMIEKTLELNYRVPDEKRLAWARPIAAKIENDLPKNKEEVYAREALILHERQKTSVKLQAIRIGDLTIATLPNEVYAITGLKLKEYSPFKSHFNIELANGAEGYIPPPEQHELGGYTTWPARTAGLEVKAEPKAINTLLGALEEVTGQKRREQRIEQGPYAEKIIASKPLAYWRLEEISTEYSLSSAVPILKRPGARDVFFYLSTSKCAMYLPGVGSGSGRGDQEKLRSSPFSGPEAINRCIHVAGGAIDGIVPDLGDHHSVALWFWLGRIPDDAAQPEPVLFRSGLEWVRLSSKRGGNEWNLVTPGPPESDGTPIRSRMIIGSDPSAMKYGPNALLENSWHFLVYSRKGAETAVFIDGKKEISSKLETWPKRGPKQDISHLAFGDSFEGKLDEITVWDRVLEPDFIAHLWKTSKVEEFHALHGVEQQEKAKRAQTAALLKQHENWSASMRFRSKFAHKDGSHTEYLISRGPKGNSQVPGDHLGISGTYISSTQKESQPGRLFIFNGNAANQIVRGKTIIEPKAWNDVKMERNGSHVKVTLNGTVEIDAELPVTAPGANDLFFGKRCDGFEGLQGEISDVVVTGLEKPNATPPPKLQTATPPLSPEDSAKQWHLPSGYRIELVAAEPVVLDPVAFDWDDIGRLWVIEMADYPLGMDGNGKAGGRVVMLEDTNSDGRYDKRTVIVNDLSYPTGILTWRDGVIVTAAPDIFFIKPKGEKQVLFTGFSTGNQQLRVNGLRWGMDGWVYCAAGAHHGGYNKGTQIESKLTGQKIDLGSRDFRFKPDSGEFDPQSGPSQFGRARDDWGHWFGVQNSFPLWHYVLQDHYLRRNPHVIPPDPIHQLFPRNPSVYPASSMEKRFHSFDQAGRFTSACGIEVYRDRMLFNDGKTHAFTCEPFHNVVQHHILEDDGVTFKATRDPAESKMDFLASEDRWCRPVMVRTGPDGALWVADMYRYMIEHPQWLPQNGKDELLPHYREGDDKGRIWKITCAPAPPKGGTTIQGLASSNGWQRDKAQMQLAWSGKKTAIEDLLKSKQPQTQAQAAWTLLAMKNLRTAACLALLADESPQVREQALQMAEKLELKDNESSSLQKTLTELVHDKDEKVQLQLACTLGELKGDWAADLLAELLHAAPAGSPLQGAALSSVMPHLDRVCARFPGGGEPENNGVIRMLFQCALAVKNETAIASLLSHEGAQSHASELLAVLDEKGLSLSAFTQQVSSAEAQQGLKKMADLLHMAAEQVNAAQAAPPMAAVALLASDREHREMVKALLPELWKKSASPEVLRLVAKLQPKDGPDFLLAGWNERTPAVRVQIIETLLSSDAWTLALLKRPEAKSCDAALRARLTKHPKKEIAKQAAAVFADATSATRAAVVEKFKPALKLKGDAAKGKTTFAQVCISCHKLDGVGIELGPDLRSVVQHDAEKLLNSILDPSAIIEPGFMAYHCTLKNGEQLYGVIATETSASLTLKMAGNLTKSVLRSEIASLQSTGTSLMPEGLEAALTPQSLADLIAYLKVVK